MTHFRRVPLLVLIASIALLPGFARADATANEKLSDAIIKGDLAAVKAALDGGADIKAPNAKKMPPICLAAYLGKTEIVSFLAEKGADVNQNDGFGFTPLMCAAVRGEPGAAKALLAAGADPALKGGNGNDALTTARPNGAADRFASGKAEVTKLLQEAIAKKAAAPQPVPPPADHKPKVIVDPTPHAPAAANDQGSFGPLHFKPLDPRTWKPKMDGKNEVFETAVPPPDFATLTLFAIQEVGNDEPSFLKAFDAAVTAETKARGVTKVVKDSGNQSQNPDANTHIVVRKIDGDTKDFGTRHLFVGIHNAGRMQIIAFQTSGDETFNLHLKEVQDFLANLNLDAKK